MTARLAAVGIAVAVGLSALSASAAGTPPSAAEETKVPEASRWASFAQLVVARWDVRAAAETDPAERAVLFRRCVEDAWFLPAPALVDGSDTGCARLLPENAARARKSVREEWRQRFHRTAAPTRAQYFACVRDAGDRADPLLVPICGLALRPRAQLVAAVDDQERFGAWLAECKRVMLGPPPAPAGENARVASAPSSTRAADDVHARHCFRTLPTLYEVQWLRKVSDFWTPDEQRRLHARARELGLGE